MVPSAPRQPAIVPLSVAKMNRAPGLEPVPTGKLDESALNTIPVGAPATETFRFTFPPAALYSVEKSAPLSETHQGDVGPATSPHALRRRVSTPGPGGPRLDTSGVITYVFGFCAAAGDAASTATVARANTSRPDFLQPANAETRPMNSDPFRPTRDPCKGITVCPKSRFAAARRS